MKWSDFFDCPEEIFIGACLQFPLYFIVGWWIAPIMVLCGLLWRLGGVSGGIKLARRIGVPLVICTISAIYTHKLSLIIAIPFMVWLNPFSYGKESWAYKWLKNDFLVRILGFAWYWFIFSLCLIIGNCEYLYK